LLARAEAELEKLTKKSILSYLLRMPDIPGFYGKSSNLHLSSTAWVSPIS